MHFLSLLALATSFFQYIVCLDSSSTSSISSQPISPHRKLYFVSDFDGTVAHYERYNSDENNRTEEGTSVDEESSLVHLPASTGTGKIAHVSRYSLELLLRIQALLRENQSACICASGQRVSTMKQRQVHFPAFDYWISENGGRIHDADLVELSEWTEVVKYCCNLYTFTYNSEPVFICPFRNIFKYVESDVEGRDVLDSFAASLAEQEIPGVKLDRSGYYTMLRVKGPIEALVNIAEKVPAGLKTTYNLGYLDIQLARCGKLSAIRWLLRHLNKRKRQEEECHDDEQFLYMGDDDNDVEPMSAALHAYVAQPCSEAVQKFVDSHASPESIFQTKLRGTKGTEELLMKVSNFIVKTSNFEQEGDFRYKTHEKVSSSASIRAKNSLTRSSDSDLSATNTADIEHTHNSGQNNFHARNRNTRNRNARSLSASDKIVLAVRDMLQKPKWLVSALLIGVIIVM